MKDKKDEKTFLVKMNGKYVLCSITISLDNYGNYRINYNPLHSTCKDFTDFMVSDILCVKSMYDKNIQYDVFSSSLRTKNSRGDDYAIFFNNDAVNVHNTSGIGWNDMMINCVAKLCRITGEYDSDHTHVTRDGYSWTMHNSCLRYINIDLFSVV